VGAAGFQRREFRLPFAAVVGCNLLVEVCECDPDGFTGLRPAPDQHRLVLLQHHVAGENMRQAHFRPGGSRQSARHGQGHHSQTDCDTQS